MLSKTEILEKLGGYNEMPPNWETIQESEFLWRFGQKHANGGTDFRQVVLPSVPFGKDRRYRGERETFCNVFMWVNFDFAGVGFIIHYNGMATRSESDAYHAQWFKFHYCDHEFITITQRMCYWEGQCSKCGFVKAVDSSG